MRKNYKHLITGTCVVVSLLVASPAYSQAVIFPQQQQAETALLTTEGDVYTLKNNLLEAQFIKADGTLKFNGCAAMNLAAGTELFKVVLGDGTEFYASDMKLVSVTTEDLVGDALAVKGSDRFHGKAIKAVFTKDKLTINWQAVLRDGSHYLRTEMDLSGEGDVQMQSVTPMIYNVDNIAAGSVPQVVGNTRGAVLASDKIFAGLETPMGLNSVKGNNSSLLGFTPKSWTTASFNWQPGEELPEGLLKVVAEDGGKQYPVTKEKVSAARGYVTFREEGEQTITFKYKGGSHRLQIIGVDVTDGSGKVVASDYHFGYTGGSMANNVYTLNIPKKGGYILRYFVETASQTIDSNGEITFSKKIGTPVVVYAKPGQEVEKPAARIARAAKALTSGTPFTFNWEQSSWTACTEGNVPKGILDLGQTFDNISIHEQDIEISGETSSLKAEFQYSSGNNRLQIVGVDVVKDGQVIGSDYHFGYTGNSAEKNVFNLNIKGNGACKLRYFVTKAGSGEGLNSQGTVTNTWTEGAVTPEQPETPTDPNVTVFEEDVPVKETWNTSYWTKAEASEVPGRIGEMGHEAEHIYKHEKQIQVTGKDVVINTEFLYKGGSNRLQIVGVDVLQGKDAIGYDYHFGYTGTNKEGNTYTVKLPFNGTFTLRYLVSMKNESNTSNGEITNVMTVAPDTIYLAAPKISPIEGQWRRNTTLKDGKTWNVSAVVGLIADDQPRRSFLAYSERERAVPWRALPVYISWYELNIDRNNAAPPTYKGNMTQEQCTDVVQHWHNDFFKKYKKAPAAFVWDDGWDEYGTWRFNPNFPTGFSEPDKIGRTMGAGQGAWLGPVGGYGGSGNYRRDYWKDKGGMQLSNESYYQYFIESCSKMIDDYDFRFFKFDGISAQWSAVGPDAGDKGIENAEGIISIERDIRKKKADIFLNTTVGTWASPFWFRFTDAVWRQENDWSTIGNQGSDRERWITYRDRLVYQNFVQNSPMCPINTLMTHGFILTDFGAVSKDMNYDGIVRELRCAFACGSGMVELYNDYKLMNKIGNGKLWKELADCMDWQERNADVLPDIHWVGGNPWDGAKANIYGWAAWNGKKSTFTLRNPSTSQQTIKLTLRQALEIPAFVNTNVTMVKSFADQVALEGLEEGKPINIDTELTITMPGSSVFVFEGTDDNPTNFDSVGTGIKDVETVKPMADNKVYDLAGRQLNAPKRGVNIINGKKVIK